MHTIDISDVDRDGWLHLRSRGIGGSDAAGILGLSLWESPMSIWAAKTGRSEPKVLTFAMDMGNRLEPIVAELAQDELGREVTERQVMCIDDEHDYLLGNVDRWLDPDAILEIKTAGVRQIAAWEAGVPPYYEAQVRHYLMVTGRELGIVAVLLGGQELRTYEIARDPMYEDWMREAEIEFWEQHVVTDVPPPPDSAEATKKALARMYHGKKDTKVYATPEIESLLLLRDEKAKYLATIEADIIGIDNAVRAFMCDNEILLGGPAAEVLVTWKSQIRRTVDTKALKEDQPELAAKYMRESTSRTFLVK